MIKPKLSKIIRSRNNDYSWKAKIQILGKIINFNILKSLNEYIDKKDVLQTLFDAEKNIEKYGWKNLPDELKRMYIMLYLNEKYDVKEVSVYLKDYYAASVVKLPEFTDKLNRYFGMGHGRLLRSSKVEIMLHGYIDKNLSAIILWIFKKPIYINIDTKEKEAAKEIMKFFINPEPYLNKLGVKKIAIPNKVVLDKFEIEDATIIYLADKDSISI